MKKCQKTLQDSCHSMSICCIFLSTFTIIFVHFLFILLWLWLKKGKENLNYCRDSDGNITDPKLCSMESSFLSCDPHVQLVFVTYSESLIEPFIQYCNGLPGPSCVHWYLLFSTLSPSATCEYKTSRAMCYLLLKKPDCYFSSR